jgi:hypothetical protein
VQFGTFFKNHDMHDKIAFFKIQLQFAKSFHSFVSNLAQANLRNDQKLIKAT